MSGQLVRLIHWNEKEAAEKAKALLAAGFDVHWQMPRGPGLRSELKATAPAAIVISLDRLPSQGRDVAMGLRATAATRRIPLVFAGGKKEKVAPVREKLPDAAYASWANLAAVVRRAIAAPPAHPIKAKSALSAYADTPLARKLGIKAGSKVALLDPPRAFYQALGPLPEDAQLVEGMEKNCHLAIWFARDRGDLRQRPPRCDCPLWIAWPKQASEHASDLTQQRVREFGLGAGLVDYKICSIDKTWSGLLFRRRQAKRK